MTKRNVNSLKGVEKELFSDTERFELWIGKNWKKCAIVLVAAAVIFVVVLMVIRHHDRKAQHAAELLVDTPVQDLAAVLEKNPDAAGAAVARLRLARTLTENKDYAGALKQYDMLAGDTELDPFFRLLAGVESISVRELADDPDGAIGACAAIAANPDMPQDIRLMMIWQQGRLLIAGKKFDEAKKVLSQAASFTADESNASAALWRRNCEMLLSALDNGDLTAAPAKTAAPAPQAVPAPQATPAPQAAPAAPAPQAAPAAPAPQAAPAKK